MRQTQVTASTRTLSYRPATRAEDVSPEAYPCGLDTTSWAYKVKKAALDAAMEQVFRGSRTPYRTGAR